MNAEQWEIPHDSGSILRRVMRRVGLAEARNGRGRRRTLAAIGAFAIIGALAGLAIFALTRGGGDGDDGAGGVAQLQDGSGGETNAGAGDPAAAGEPGIAADGQAGDSSSLGPPPASDGDDSLPFATATPRRTGSGATNTPQPGTRQTPVPTATSVPCPLACVAVSTPTPEACPPACLPIETPTQITPLCPPVCGQAATPTPPVALPSATAPPLPTPTVPALP
jgi:hypothetical protein